MPYSLLFVAACRTVCYFLRRTVQFAIHCCMLYSLLFVAACLTVHYLLPVRFLLLHAIQSAICCHMSYNMLFVTTCCSFATCLAVIICCHLPCSLLIVVARSTVCIRCHIPYSLLFVAARSTVCYVAACHAVCYLLQHAVQFAICCSMLCSLLSVAACCTARYYSLGSYPRTSVVNCLTTGSAYNHNSLSVKVHCHKKVITAVLTTVTVSQTKSIAIKK